MLENRLFCQKLPKLRAKLPPTHSPLLQPSQVFSNMEVLRFRCLICLESLREPLKVKAEEDRSYQQPRYESLFLVVLNTDEA